jgi:hypothetical protein
MFWIESSFTISSDLLTGRGAMQRDWDLYYSFDLGFQANVIFFCVAAHSLSKE